MKAYNSPTDELHIESNSGEELVKITPNETKIKNMDLSSLGIESTPEEIDEAVGKADSIPAVTVADAGKVLGVTEEGKIAPIEGGSEQLYIHAVNITSSVGMDWLSGPYCIFVNTKSTPYTFAEFRDLVSRVNTGGDDAGYLLRFNGAISLKAFNVPYTIVNPAPTVSEYNTTRLYMAGSGFNVGDGTTNPTTVAFNTVRTGSEYFTAISDVVKPYPFE